MEASTPDSELVTVLANLIFESEVMLNMPSDELFLLSSAAQLRTLHADDDARKVRGVWIIVSGEVRATEGGVSCLLQRGDFFAEFLDEDSQIDLVPEGEVELLWIPSAQVETLCDSCPAFRSGLFTGTFRSALVALELLAPPGGSPAFELSL